MTKQKDKRPMKQIEKKVNEESIMFDLKLMIERVMKQYKKYGFGKDYSRISDTNGNELELGFYIRELNKNLKQIN